jgi:uncharacterized RDD family membrane protein YckC
MEQSIPILSSSEIQAPTAGAGFWVRVGARVIDTIVHNIVWYVAAFLVGIVISIYAMMAGISTSQIFARSGSTPAIGFILALIGSIFYQTISEYIYGASLGKLIFKIHVKNEDGQPISMKAAFIRSCAYFIDGIFFGLVAYENMKKSPLNQRLGDKWAGSVVVERTKLLQAQLPSGWKFIAAFVLAVVVDGFVAVLWTVVNLL